VLPGFASWLALRRLDQPTAAQNGAWYEVAWALTARDASSSAWLDLVLLLTGSDARFLLVVLDQAGRDDYNSSLARSWAELAANVGQAADDLLAEGLIAYLGRKHWTDDALQTDAVVGLAGLLTSDGQRPRLVSAVADALTASPMAASRPAAQDWLARVRPPAPGAGQGDVLDLLRGMAPGAEIPRLAGLCTQGFQQGVDANAICQVLIDGGLIRSGVEAMDFLSWLRVGNYVSDLDLQAEGDWLVWFHIRFADGSFGPRVTSEFRHIAISAAERDITIAVNMVYILATKGQRDASPDLTDEEIDQLSWIPKSIEQILKDARKRRPKLRSGRHGRNEPEPGPVPDGPRTEPPPLEVTRGTAAQAGDHPHG
jgi:hypothetical protein